jgi:hypothetical protein
MKRMMFVKVEQVIMRKLMVLAVEGMLETLASGYDWIEKRHKKDHLIPI